MENLPSSKNEKEADLEDTSKFEEPQYYEKEDARYWQDSHQILSLLPPEVWDHICSFLDGKDIFNFNNCSLYFRELLLQKRVLFLYKPVTEILLDRHSERNAGTSLLPSLVQNRLVCKAWKRSFDEIASKYDSHTNKDDKVALWLSCMSSEFLSKRVREFLSRVYSPKLH